MIACLPNWPILTQRKVGVIVFVGAFPTEELLEQARASAIPIVLANSDPVRLGFVASMNRPGGNVTGVITLVGNLSGKQLGLLHDSLFPKGKRLLRRRGEKTQLRRAPAPANLNKAPVTLAVCRR
jgi:hypothetical protein